MLPFSSRIASSRSVAFSISGNDSTAESRPMSSEARSGVAGRIAPSSIVFVSVARFNHAFRH